MSGIEQMRGLLLDSKEIGDAIHTRAKYAFCDGKVKELNWSVEKISEAIGQMNQLRQQSNDRAQIFAIESTITNFTVLDRVFRIGLKECEVEREQARLACRLKGEGKRE